MICSLACLAVVIAEEAIEPAQLQTIGLSKEEIEVVEDLADDFNGAVLLVSGMYRGLWPEDQFRAQFHIVETKDKIEENKKDVVSYILLQNNKKDWSSISEVRGAGRNTRILQDGRSLWFHQKGSRRALRISPAQRLLGGASYADIASTNYFYDYDVVDRSDVMIGKTEAYLLRLQASRKGVAYETLHYWVDKKDFRPIKTVFFSKSGKTLKTMYYRAYKTMQERQISTEWIIVDGLKDNLLTYIFLLSMDGETLPKQYFNYTGFPELP